MFCCSLAVCSAAWCAGFSAGCGASIHLLPKPQGDPDKEKRLIIVFNSPLVWTETSVQAPVQAPRNHSATWVPRVLFQHTQHKEMCSPQNEKVASSSLCSTVQGAGGTLLWLKTAIYTEAWIICPGNMSGKWAKGDKYKDSQRAG